MRHWTSALFAVLSLVIAVDAAVAAPNCPNRPPGATTLLDCSFNSPNCSGELGGPLWELYPGAGQITQPGGNPASPPNADTSILYAGQSVGGQQTIWPNPGNQQPLTNLYLCLPFKMSPGFVGQRTANKLIFMAAQDWTYGKQGGNGFFGLGQGGGVYPPSSFYMYFGHNSGNLNNAHACAFDLGLQCNPNVTTTQLVPDTWYTFEAYIISSSTSTARNGTVKWWINNTLQGNYTNLNYIDGIVNQFQINHTWDGGAAVQCGPPTNPSNPGGRDCRIDQKYHFDHIVLASVGGVSPGQGGGGGTSPPPPNPDTPAGPPAVPTGLNAQKVTQ